MIQLKGKPLSLSAKILAVFIVVGALILKATHYPDLDIDAAIKVGGFVVIVFGTVDVSLIMESIFGSGGSRGHTPQYESDGAALPPNNEGGSL